MALSDRDKPGTAVLDAIRESRPPFSPEGVVEEFAALLKAYHCAKVVGDRYAGEWPREQFRKQGITYETSERTKSAIYLDSLPLLNSAKLELLDHPRLIAQICALERRTARGGKDSIDHPPGSHDDVATRPGLPAPRRRQVRPAADQRRSTGEVPRPDAPRRRGLGPAAPGPFPRKIPPMTRHKNFHQHSDRKPNIDEPPRYFRKHHPNTVEELDAFLSLPGPPRPRSTTSAPKLYLHEAISIPIPKRNPRNDQYAPARPQAPL